MTKQQLQQELKQSMLAKNELKTSVLRLLLSAINYYEIQKGLPRRPPRIDRVETGVKAGGAGYTASAENVLTVIQQQIKQRRESIEQFKAGGRQDLADKEQKELEILQTYLPEQLSNEEIKKLVIEAIKETGAQSVQDMGKVMAVFMPKVKGKADGGLVSQIVKEQLLSSS